MIGTRAPASKSRSRPYIAEGLETLNVMDEISQYDASYAMTMDRLKEWVVEDGQDEHDISRSWRIFLPALSHLRLTAALPIFGRFRPGNDPGAVRRRVKVPFRNSLNSRGMNINNFSIFRVLKNL